MPGRLRWGSLLLLAAVFLMHGLQCVVAEPGGGHGATTTAAEAVQHASAADAVTGGLAVGLRLTAGVVPGAVDLVTAGHPVEHGPLHAADLWAACLAVVMGGLVLLGAMNLLRRSTVAPVRGSPAAVPFARRTVLGRLRAPDLSSLCVLRI